MKSIFAIFILMLIASNASAKIYKCNINGQSVYRDKPCPKSQGKELKIQKNKKSDDYIYIAENLSNSEGLSLLEKIPKLNFRKKDTYTIDDIRQYISSLDLAGREASGCKIEVSIYYHLKKDDCKRLFSSYLIPYYEAKFNIDTILKNNKKHSPELVAYIDDNLEKINNKTEYFQTNLIPLKQILQRNLN